MDRDHMAAQLAVIAATATVAEKDTRAGRHWRGDLSRQLATIREALVKAELLAKRYERAITMNGGN